MSVKDFVDAITAMESRAAVEEAIDLSQGNPGAASAMGQLLAAGHYMLIEDIKNLGLRGPAIWLLFNDYCKRDVAKFADTLMRPPKDDITKLLEQNGVEVPKVLIVEPARKFAFGDGR